MKNGTLIRIKTFRTRPHCLNDYINVKASVRKPFPDLYILALAQPNLMVIFRSSSFLNLNETGEDKATEKNQRIKSILQGCFGYSVHPYNCVHYCGCLTQKYTANVIVLRSRDFGSDNWSQRSSIGSAESQCNAASFSAPAIHEAEIILVRER